VLGLALARRGQSSVESGFVRASLGAVPRRRFFPEGLFELRFANGALQVYEAHE
jgi:hypothetical protein